MRTVGRPQGLKEKKDRLKKEGDGLEKERKRRWKEQEKRAGGNTANMREGKKRARWSDSFRDLLPPHFSDAGLRGVASNQFSISLNLTFTPTLLCGGESNQSLNVSLFNPL